MHDMEEYMQCLDEIAITNHVDECDPEDQIRLPAVPKEVNKEDKKEDNNNLEIREDDMSNDGDGC